MKHYYELTYLANPKMSDEQAEAFGGQIGEIIKGQGEILNANPLKKIKLAYEIKKNTRGFLGVVTFNADPEKIIAVKKAMDDNAEVVRFIIIKRKVEVKKEKTVPSPLSDGKETEEPAKRSVVKKIVKSLTNDETEKNKGKADMKEIEKELDEII